MATPAQRRDNDNDGGETSNETTKGLRSVIILCYRYPLLNTTVENHHL